MEECKTAYAGKRNNRSTSGLSLLFVEPVWTINVDEELGGFKTPNLRAPSRIKARNNTRETGFILLTFSLTDFSVGISSPTSPHFFWSFSRYMHLQFEID